MDFFIGIVNNCVQSTEAPHAGEDLDLLSEN